MTLWLFPVTKAGEGNGTSFQVPCVLFNLIITIIHWIDRITLCSRRGHGAPETSKFLHIVAQPASGDPSIQSWSGCDLPPYLPGWVEGLSLWRHTWRRHEYAQLHTRVPVPFSLHMIMSPPVSVSPERGHSEYCWTGFRSGACPGRGTGGCKFQGRCGAGARCAVGGLLCEGGHPSLFQPPPEWSEASWGLGSISDSLLANWSRVKCSLGVPVAGLDISQLVAWCLAPARQSDRCFDPSFSPWLGSDSQLGGKCPCLPS